MSGYRRDRVTRAVFAMLLSFGMLNAGLGPALPYLRDSEHVSYLAGALHQAAFALGGGAAGLFAARARRPAGRALVIRGGLLGAALAWVAIGYGDALDLTVGAALMVSLLATSALVRLWAVLADVHGSRRTVAMAEGEVSVSMGSIVSPVLIAAAAGTALGWRGSFLVAAVLVGACVLGTAWVPIPASERRPVARQSLLVGRGRVPPMLVVTFAIVALEFSLAFWLASYLTDEVRLDRVVAVSMVSGLYGANLMGRVLISVLAHRFSAATLLAGALVVAALGMPVLLTAAGAVKAAVGLSVLGIGIGAMFPLTSSLHVAASTTDADAAIGQVLVAASAGQIVGPLLVGALAQAFDLRIALLTMTGYLLLGAGGLRRAVSPPAGPG